MLERDQLESESLKWLLKEFEYEDGIAVIDRKMSQVLVDTEEDTSLLNYVMFASIQRSVSEYVTAFRELENNLLFESKFEDTEQQLNIAEGDIFKDIQAVWVAENIKSNSRRKGRKS